MIERHTKMNNRIIISLGLTQLFTIKSKLE